MKSNKKVRQRESFNILLSNWDRVKELTEESANAAGTADEKYTAYMDSMEAATKRLQNAWEGFAQSLEVSPVMKFLTNTTAGLVENLEPLLKYSGTLLAALNSAKIVSAFAQGGAVGGFWGLVKEIPIVGDLFKVNDNVKRIADDVATIKNNQVTETKSSIKEESRLSRLWKGATGRHDVIDPKTGTAISLKALSLYKKQKAGLRLADDWEKYSAGLSESDKQLLRLTSVPNQRTDLDDTALRALKILTKRRISNAAFGGGATLLTQLFSNKTVGTQSGGLGGILSKLVVGAENEQTVEETSGDKALRVGLSAGLAAIGGAVAGPLGATLGNVLGEGFASMFSTWFHRDELEMKQRVQEAKERYNQLNAIQTSIDNISTDLGAGAEDYETYQKRKKEVEEIKSSFDVLDDDVKSEVNIAVKKFGYDSYYDMADALLDTNLTTAERAEIKRELQHVVSMKQTEYYDKSLETSFNELSEAKRGLSNQIAGGLNWFKYGDWLSTFADTYGMFARNTEFQKAIAVAKERGILTEGSFMSPDAYGGGAIWDIRAAGDTEEERVANVSKFKDILSNVDLDKGWVGDDIVRKLLLGGSAKSLLKSMLTVADETINSVSQEKELKSKWQQQYALAGLYGSGLTTMKPSQLKGLGMEGAIQEIADSLERDFGEAIVGRIRDENGNILKDVHDDIKKIIKDNEELYNSLVAPQISIKDWRESNKELKDSIAELKDFGIESEEDLRKAAEKGGEDFENMANKLGMTTVQLRSLINTGGKDYFSQMAKAIDLSETQLSRLVDKIKGLDKVSFSAFTFSVSQITEKFDLMREAYLAAIDGTWVGDEEILNKINGDDFIKGFITNLNDAEQTAKDLGDVLYSTNETLEEFLIGVAAFAEIKTSASQMEGFLKYLKEVAPELAKAVADMNNIQEVLDYIIENPENTALLNYLKEYAKIQEKTRYGEELEKSFSAITKSNEKQIKNLQEQKDALSQINDEHKKELEYIKAKYALEDARKTKVRVYRQGVGWTYQADETAIAEAKEALETLDVEKQQELIQSQIDILEKQNSILENLPEEKELQELNSILKDVIGSTSSVDESIKKLVDKYTNPNYKYTVDDYIDNYLENSDYKVIKDLIAENPTKFTYGNYETWGELFTEDQKKTWDKLTNDQKLSIKSLAEEANKISYKKITDFVKENGLRSGDFYRWGEAFGVAGLLDDWGKLTKEQRETLRDNIAIKDEVEKNASGATSFAGGLSLVNELGTEAIITPSGTVTALPSKTGIVPADITRNVWALGEVAPTLVAQLGSLTQKMPSGNAGNTTYEEGQYFDNFTMNVYPAKGDDFNKILEQARAQMRLTRHNN